MNPLESMRTMISTTGKSMRVVSGEMGKSPNYLSATFTQGMQPKAQTLIAVADACGYDVLLRSRQTGETVTLDNKGTE